jgi:hypothetical protein
MKCLKRVLIFFVVNTALIYLTIAVNPFPNPFHQLITIILAFAVTGLITYLLFRLKEQRIWYFPISQVIMCFCGCLCHAYIRKEQMV